MRFTASQPVGCLPALDTDENARFAATATQLRDAYQALRRPEPTSARLETTT